MLGRSKRNRQLDVFDIPMKRFIDLNHELVIRGDSINWEHLEKYFIEYFSQRGRPSVPVRKIVGLLILKNHFNLPEEKALDIWCENPYWQYFCGEVHFQKGKPFSIGEFGRFKRRVGEKGMEQIQFLSEEQFGSEENQTYQKYRDSKKAGFWDRFFGARN